MGVKYAYLIYIIIFGTVVYLLIALLILGIYQSSAYDPLVIGYIDPRPPNVYLRSPWKLSNGICENTTCMKEKETNWTLILFVKSKIDYFVRRELIRRTWGSISYFNGARLEVVFLMGATDNQIAINLLNEEDARYGDLLQFDGPDNYRSMPFKVLAGMEWASHHLDYNTLYASADDDFIISMPEFVKNMTEVVDQFQYRKKSEFPIVCLFVKGTKERPVRVRDKWRVSYYEYRSDVYPTYCHGGMYVTSVPVAHNLWNVSRTAPMLRLDDVWITGILRKRMNFSDDLVYSMPVTLHFGTVTELIKKRMITVWNNVSSSFKHSSYCRCVM